MCQKSKRDHNSNCHNNCRIHHPIFFNYYQYSVFPPCGCGTAPLVQYSIPQAQYSPLFAQYQYYPIIHYPMAAGPQPNQSFPLGQSYQYSPHNIGQNFNNLVNNAISNDDFQYHPVREDSYLSPYNSHISLGTERYYNDFRRPSLQLSAEEEYNWAVHISDILDEFIGRHRSRPKYNFDEYQNLKQTLDTSLLHLKEAEALNKKLVNTWEKKDDNSSNNAADYNSSNNNYVHLPTDSIYSKLLKSKSDKSDALNEKKVYPIIVSSEPKKSPSLTENNTEYKFNFLYFEDNSDNNFNPEYDTHSFFFNDEFKVWYSPEKNDNYISKNDNDVNKVAAEDIHDFLGVKSPDFDLMESNPEIIETDVLDDEIIFVDIDKVKDTKPAFWTYKDYTIKTSLGEKQASEIYPKISDEYGHLKMDHYEAMAQFGLTEKQYDQLIENFYHAKKNKTKKIKKNKFGVVTKSKFNAKVFWITISVLGVILLLIAITVILYFTVPCVTEGIDTIIVKIKKIF